MNPSDGVQKLAAALSVVLLALAGRRLWPASPATQWTAVALLVASTQFLFAATSGFSMPAHLALGLGWLWLYLRATPAAWAARGPLGALGLGLHSPFPHALFVAPFLVRLLRERRLGWLLYLGAWYGAAAVAWLLWLRAFRDVEASSTAAGSGFAIMPSSPAPSNCSNHSSASAGSSVVRVR